jgi:TetR/AcrR family transcriptional repressor of nem operon
MRYPPDHREKTRQRILDAASIVFKRQGFQAGSVDDVMAEAGLTAGAFYAHFKSKDDLFTEALIRTLSQGRVLSGRDDESLQGEERIRSIVKKYLSPAHRSIIDRGCPLPPLLGDLPRRSEETRQAFQDVVSDLAANLSQHLPENQSAGTSDQALALISIMVGGLSLSRAVSDDKLGDRILASCRDLIDRLLDQSNTTNPELPTHDDASSE